MIDTASVGGPVTVEEGNAAPILDVAAPALGPRLNTPTIPELPRELQPEPGDVLLSRAFWPWTDLGAQGIPEHWLYMSRHVQGVIAQLSVQTPSGPRLVKGNPDGSVSVSFPQTGLVKAFNAGPLLAAAQVDIIAGIPNQTIAVYAYSVDMAEPAPAANGIIVAIQGTLSGRFVMAVGLSDTRHWVGRFSAPFIMRSGEGLFIINGDSITHNLAGSIEYTQQ